MTLEKLTSELSEVLEIIKQGDYREALNLYLQLSKEFSDDSILSEAVLKLIDEIGEITLSILFDSGEPADGLFSGAPYLLVMDTVSFITRDKCSTCDLVIMDDGLGRYSIIGEKQAYWAGITESNLFYVMINDPEIPPENQIILIHSIPEREVLEEIEEEKPEAEERIDLDKNEDMFKAIIRVCKALNVKPDKLFYVEHGMDSGEWEPEMPFAPEEYPKILEEIDSSWFGYQVNFDLEIAEGGVYGRSNPGWGVWMVIRGSKQFVEKVKSLIVDT